MVKILNSDLYVFLIKICQWGNFRNEQKFFSFIKYPKITINDHIDNTFIYNYFKLTNNEIDVIIKFK